MTFMVPCIIIQFYTKWPTRCSCVG